MSHAFSEGAWCSQPMMRHKYTNSHLLPISPDFSEYFNTPRLNPNHPINPIHSDSSFRDLEENQTTPYYSSPSYKSWNTSLPCSYFPATQIPKHFQTLSQTWTSFFNFTFQTKTKYTKWHQRREPKHSPLSTGRPRHSTTKTFRSVLWIKGSSLDNYSPNQPNNSSRRRGWRIFWLEWRRRRFQGSWNSTWRDTA